MKSQQNARHDPQIICFPKFVWLIEIYGVDHNSGRPCFDSKSVCSGMRQAFRYHAVFSKALTASATVSIGPTNDRRRNSWRVSLQTFCHFELLLQVQQASQPIQSAETLPRELGIT
jgi:hypothetical protein